MYDSRQPGVDALQCLKRVDGAGTNVYTYDASGRVLSEGGRWPRDTVSYVYANRLRTALFLEEPTTASWVQSYGHDTARRVSSVSSAAGAFYLTYKGPSLRVTNTVLGNLCSITNSYDSNGRLTRTVLTDGAGVVRNSHAYGYNVGNQRTFMTNTVGNYWSYTYDNAGQLQSAIGKEAGGTVRGHEFLGYKYDAAGNLNVRTNSYAAGGVEQHFNVDALNQLSTSTRAGFVNNYMGGFAAAAPSSMVLNGFLGPTIYSDNAFAQGGLALTNGPQSFSLVATDASGRTATDSMTQTYPTNVAFAYDDNGNMTSDGRLGYAYDDENQLIRIMATNAWKSEFTYDGRMRMRIRKEYNWQSSAWIRTNEVHYIYDGMLVIQERDANNVSRVSYTRGNDLSGTLEGAGGIGGLLARTDNAQLRAGIYSANAYYHCDGNGNITMLVNAFQFPVAKYNYDPYGNCTAYAGPLAEANVYRFSSKEFHAQSGLSYYGYRFYSPVLQRWLNRDPVQEVGGLNLYSFVRNDPLDRFDGVGWADADFCFLGCLGQLHRNEIAAIARITVNNAPSLGTGVIMTSVDIAIGSTAVATGGATAIVYIGFTATTAALDVYAARQVFDSADREKQLVNGAFARCLNGCRRTCRNSDDEAKRFFDENKWK